MRILTVKQPWAWAIIHGGKDVENRVRNIAGGYRGSVAIHVGMVDADNAPESLWFDHAQFYRDTKEIPLSRSSWRDTDRGHIIGVVDLTDVHRHTLRVQTQPGAPFDELPCSPWSMADHHHLILANPHALTEPIQYRGALGLRTLDPETVALIESRLT